MKPVPAQAIFSVEFVLRIWAAPDFLVAPRSARPRIPKESPGTIL